MKTVLAFIALVGITIIHPFAYASDDLVKHNAVILLYHHVSSDTPPSTSISPEKFTEHMQYIASNHTVVSLEVLVDALTKGTELPENSVAITFDDGYKNIAQNAHPILKRHGFEYTIFINPTQIGLTPQQLDWSEVKQLQQEGVTFANHTSYHNHLLTGSEQPDWLEKTMQDIQKAESELQEKTGKSWKWLAYPYGEFNLRLQQEVAKAGYIAFGQHSGAVAPHSDMTALPRVPAAGIYANLETLKTKLSSFAMPITDKAISDPELSHQQRQPRQTLTIDLSDIRPNQLACFYNGKTIDLVWKENSVELILPKALSVGRSRINCTAPSKTLPKRFYWYSQPWFVPAKDGSWPD